MTPRILRALAGAALLAPFCAASGLAAETGTATVTRGGTTHTFLVIQCLRDQKAAFGDAIIEFQLDGVPEGTPAETIAGLLGSVEAGDNIQQMILPVVEHGPILSITRVSGGGEQVAVTDMADLMWISDGSPMDTGSRFLDIGDGEGARVSGSATAAGQALSVEATCPG